MLYFNGIFDGVNRQNVVQSGLQLNLNASNTNSYPKTGTSWFDLSTNNYTATLQNYISVPTYDSNNGGSIIVNGSPKYIGWPGNYFNFLNFTISVWMKAASFTNYQNIIYKGDTTAGQYGIIINTAGNWAVEPAAGFLTNTLVLNTWYYLTGTYDGTTVTAYNNSANVGTALAINSVRGIETTIGTDLPNSRYFNGLIGGAQIYNRALTSAEVLQNFNATKARYNV